MPKSELSIIFAVDSALCSRSGENSTVFQKLRLNIARPLEMLFTEPIVSLFAVYAAVVYGSLYMCFAAFPVVFQEERGWSQGVGGLAFIVSPHHFYDHS